MLGPASGAPGRRGPPADEPRAAAADRRRDATAAGGAAAQLRRGAGQLGRDVPREGVLRGLRILGTRAMPEVRDEGVRARVPGDASRGVRDAVWNVRGVQDVCNLYCLWRFI